MSTLYRKHRPQKFSEIVGQNHIKITLQHEVETGELAHAYLFAGPRGIGKTTMARILAKAVNCINRQEGDCEPCNQCESCLAITNNQSLDVVEIDAASHTGVDNVRENIISNARIAPAQSKYKVFIIDEVHMLSTSAFNALLKIIEEPPANVIFILCTTEIHKVPTTIISRCQRFDFKKISLNDIVNKLERIAEAEKIKIDKEVLIEIARHSEGHLRDAESLLGQIISISAGKVTVKDASLIIPRSDVQAVVKLLKYLGKKDAAQAIRLINELVEGGIDLKTFVVNLIEVGRKIMLSKLDASLARQFSWEWGQVIEEQIEEVKNLFSLNDLTLVIEEFSQSLIGLKTAFLPQLPLELAVVKLTSVNLVRPEQQKFSKETAKGKSEASQKSVASTKENIKTIDQVGLEQNQVDSLISLQTIADRWSEVLAKITKYNHSLSLILRVSQPCRLEDNKLQLAFKYKFHKERIENPQVKILIEKALAEVFGIDLKVEAKVDESLEINNGVSNEVKPESLQTNSNGSEAVNTKNNQTKEIIDDLLKTFGGRIVE